MSEKINKSISIHLFQVILMGVILASTVSCRSGLEKKQLSIIRADGSVVPVLAEMARSEAERNYGFMNRKKIPDGTGMLFLFENDQILDFWMKNTPHPLSIAYIDSSGTIRDILDMEPFSLADIKSSCSVRYALEVPQGWFTRTHIKSGDKLTIDFWHN